MSQTPESEIPSSHKHSGAPLTQAQKANIRAKKWYAANKERRSTYVKGWNAKNRSKISAYQKTYKARLRKEVVGYYSRYEYRCICCHEDSWEFLTIDHIEGNGSAHRREIGSRGGHSFYVWLIKNNFPQGYRVLCSNCNHSLGVWGYCPHMPLSTTSPL